MSNPPSDPQRAEQNQPDRTPLGQKPLAKNQLGLNQPERIEPPNTNLVEAVTEIDPLPQRQTLWQRYLPHPLLTIVLVFLWMALLNSFTTGGLVVGIVLGTVIPIYTSNFWPDRPVIRKPWLVFNLLGILLMEIFMANFQVAYRILFRDADQLQMRWVKVPLDVTNPEALAVLMSMLTLSPGTVAVDLSADGHSMLMYCLDLQDEEQLIHTIKTRYERRIKEIFP